jgi:hypothetical protein
MKIGNGGFHFDVGEARVGVSETGGRKTSVSLKLGGGGKSWEQIRGFLVRTSGGTFIDLPDTAMHLECRSLLSLRGQTFPAQEESSLSHVSSEQKKEVEVGLTIERNQPLVELMAIVLTDMSDWYQFAQNLTISDGMQFTLSSPFVFDRSEPTRAFPRKRKRSPSSSPTANQAPSFPPSQPVLNEYDAPAMVPTMPAARDPVDEAPSMVPSERHGTGHDDDEL